MMNTTKYWVKTLIKKIVITRKGKKPSKLSINRFADSIPYLDIQAIEKGVINQYADSYSTVIASSNDLFIVADGSRSGLVCRGMDGAVGSTILCITPIGVHELYLYYFLKLKYEDLNSNTTGSSIPHLDIDLFLNLEIAFPSLNEQERIVKELESQLIVFDKDFTNAEEELSRLADFRKSMLNEAVLGNLTKAWRSNNVNKVTNLPNTWEEVSIMDISTFLGGGVTPKGGSSNYKETGVPFLRSQNVYPNELRLDEVAFISKEMHEQMSRTHLKPGDVLLNITGASIGRCAVVPPDFKEGNVNQHVCIIRLNERVKPEYLSLFLNSPIGYDSIMNLQTGVTRQGLNYGQIRSIKINLPPIEEQNEIINQVNIQNEKITCIESELSYKLYNVDSLQMSVLQMAFQGSLSYKKEDDDDPNILIKNLDVKRNQILEGFSKYKILQAETKAKMLKKRLSKKDLKDFIEKKYTSASFSSSELYLALGLENEYDRFNDLLFGIMQEKLDTNDDEPFLEAFYDEKLKKLVLRIKKQIL